MRNSPTFRCQCDGGSRIRPPTLPALPTHVRCSSSLLSGSPVFFLVAGVSYRLRPVLCRYRRLSLASLREVCLCSVGESGSGRQPASVWPAVCACASRVPRCEGERECVCVYVRRRPWSPPRPPIRMMTIFVPIHDGPILFPPRRPGPWMGKVGTACAPAVWPT